tara:strand:+ start:2032 stop:2679 length:648 start_codon:yes stop_codon:yes gene_type:complete
MPSDLQVDNIKDGSGTKTLATLSSSAVTLSSDVTVPASVGSSMVFLEKFTASSTTGKIFNLDSFTSYNTYVFSLNALLPATDNVSFTIQVGTSSDSFFDSGSDYRFVSSHPYYDGSTSGGPFIDTATGSLVIAPNQGNNAEYGISGTIKIFNPTSSSSKTSTRGELVALNNSEYVQPRAFAGYRLATTDDAYIKFYFSSGNIASGTITLYGLKDA